MEITGSKVKLREKFFDDAHDDYEWHRDPELARLDGISPTRLTFEQYLSNFSREMRYFRTATRHVFGIETLGGTHIGNCAYYDIDEGAGETELGILIGNRVEGGTIGRVMAASRRRGFSVIFPAGLEKLIPIPIEVAAKEAIKTDYAYSMGINCGLLPCKGITVTEPKAIEILTGAAAFPISAGGVGGAEGSVTLVIKGTDDQVKKAIEYAEQCKGAKLPTVYTPNCDTCAARLCDFPLTGKHWV